MANNQNKYHINEKDIDTVLGILKRTDPDNATPERAIELLESLQTGVHSIAEGNPQLRETLLKEIDKQKAK